MSWFYDEHQEDETRGEPLPESDGPPPLRVVKIAAASLKPGDPVYLDGVIRTVRSVALGMDGWAVTVKHDGGLHKFSSPHDMVRLAVGGS